MEPRLNAHSRPSTQRDSARQDTASQCRAGVVNTPNSQGRVAVLQQGDPELPATLHGRRRGVCHEQASAKYPVRDRNREGHSR